MLFFKLLAGLVPYGVVSFGVEKPRRRSILPRHKSRYDLPLQPALQRRPRMNDAHLLQVSKTEEQSLDLQDTNAPGLIDESSRNPGSESSVLPKNRNGRTKTKNSGDKTKDKQVSKGEPVHWVLDSDDLVFQRSGKGASNNSTVDDARTYLPSLIRFTIRGNPLPLRRHRTARGFMYNPSAASQQSFRQAVEEIIAERIKPTPGRPMFSEGDTLAITILFRMKRPKKHFVGSKPGPGRLRPTAPKQASSGLRMDVDNLAKFVLDSLNGLLYEDDRQVGSLHVTKVYDDDMKEECRGSTCVCIRLLEEDNLPQLIANSFNLFQKRNGCASENLR